MAVKLYKTKWRGKNRSSQAVWTANWLYEHSGLINPGFPSLPHLFENTSCIFHCLPWSKYSVYYLAVWKVAKHTSVFISCADKPILCSENGQSNATCPLCCKMGLVVHRCCLGLFFFLKIKRTEREGRKLYGHYSTCFFFRFLKRGTEVGL